MNKKNVIFNESMESYSKKYKNRKYRLLKYSKKDVDAFDKANNTKGFLLKNRRWALIKDTYYEIPKSPRLTWFRNLHAGTQIATCLLGAGVVAAGVTVPVVLINQRNAIIENTSDIEVSKEGDGADLIQNPVFKKQANGDYVATIKVAGGHSKSEIESIEVYVDDKLLEFEKDYEINYKTRKLTIKASAVPSPESKVKLKVVKRGEEPQPIESVEIYNEYGVNKIEVNKDLQFYFNISPKSAVAQYWQWELVNESNAGNRIDPDSGLFQARVAEECRIHLYGVDSFDNPFDAYFDIEVIEQGEDPEYIKYLSFDVREDNKIAVTHSSTPTAEIPDNLIIPSKVKGKYIDESLEKEQEYDISIIANGAFTKSKITSVTIPSTIETIETDAFAASSLSQVTFSGEGLLEIGEKCFIECKSLSSITFPKSLKTIGYNAFTTSGLTSATFLDNKSTWKITDSKEKTIAPAYNVSVAKTNAEYLTTNYKEYKWSKNTDYIDELVLDKANARIEPKGSIILKVATSSKGALPTFTTNLSGDTGLVKMTVVGDQITIASQDDAEGTVELTVSADSYKSAICTISIKKTELTDMEKFKIVYKKYSDRFQNNNNKIYSNDNIIMTDTVTEQSFINEDISYANFYNEGDKNRTLVYGDGAYIAGGILKYENLESFLSEDFIYKTDGYETTDADVGLASSDESIKLFFNKDGYIVECKMSSRNLYKLTYKGDPQDALEIYKDKLTKFKSSYNDNYEYDANAITVTSYQKATGLTTANHNLSYDKSKKECTFSFTHESNQYSIPISINSYYDEIIKHLKYTTTDDSAFSLRLGVDVVCYLNYDSTLYMHKAYVNRFGYVSDYEFDNTSSTEETKKTIEFDIDLGHIPYGEGEEIVLNKGDSSFTKENVRLKPYEYYRITFDADSIIKANNIKLTVDGKEISVNDNLKVVCGYVDKDSSCITVLKNQTNNSIVFKRPVTEETITEGKVEIVFRLNNIGYDNVTITASAG